MRKIARLQLQNLITKKIKADKTETKENTSETNKNNSTDNVRSGTFTDSINNFVGITESVVSPGIYNITQFIRIYVTVRNITNIVKETKKRLENFSTLSDLLFKNKLTETEYNKMMSLRNYKSKIQKLIVLNNGTSDTTNSTQYDKDEIVDFNKKTTENLEKSLENIKTLMYNINSEKDKNSALEEIYSFNEDLESYNTILTLKNDVDFSFLLEKVYEYVEDLEDLEISYIATSEVVTNLFKMYSEIFDILRYTKSSDLSNIKDIIVYLNKTISSLDIVTNILSEYSKIFNSNNYKSPLKYLKIEYSEKVSTSSGSSTYYSASNTITVVNYAKIKENAIRLLNTEKTRILSYLNILDKLDKSITIKPYNFSEYLFERSFKQVSVNKGSYYETKEELVYNNTCDKALITLKNDISNLKALVEKNKLALLEKIKK